MVSERLVLKAFYDAQKTERGKNSNLRLKKQLLKTHNCLSLPVRRRHKVGRFWNNIYLDLSNIEYCLVRSTVFDPKYNQDQN